VPEHAAGVRLDSFLAEHLGSRARAQALIQDGRVTVDGRPKRKRHLVAAGEVIEVDEPPWEAFAVGAAAPFRVAYEDEHLLIVDKPAGVVVHPARGNWSGTLAQALEGLAAGGEEGWRAGIVHRLDRDTSGLLVVAKDDAVHRALKALLVARRLRREYLALIEGRLDARAGTIEAPIGRSRRDRLRMSIDTDAPREARTHFTVERFFPRASLVRVVLDTGRTHQIRVHMQAIGHPVFGDRQYGGRRDYGLDRQFLHAARLEFSHPVSGEAVVAESPLPADLARALEVAARAAPPRGVSLRAGKRSKLES
jgi:23S rRNA pseudouridine1911/1915/1917 synthase